MFEAQRRGRYSLNIWPGFVDFLAQILLVFIFVLLLFVIGQFYLSKVLTGQTLAMEELHAQVDQLAQTLSLERKHTAQIEAKLSHVEQQLHTTLAERDKLRSDLQLTKAEARKLKADFANANERVSVSEQQLELKLEEIASLQANIAMLRTLRQKLEDKAGAMASKLEQQHEITTASQAKVSALSQQVQALREQLVAVADALQISKQTVTSQKAQIQHLGEQLNVALAEKVKELAGYRSEFFGRLRQVLGDVPQIRIVGDRFMFQSEVFFASASAQIGPEGKDKLNRLASVLKEVSKQIPSDIDWVLQVEGHTDSRPIHTPRFSSNWELSTARALSIVHYLISQGISPNRLAAAGYGQYDPIDPGDSAEAYARNRRIELRLTSH
ncbi:MAG: peptidoglycan -binding protein [Nitrococcus sp.]|nr:peptidoglycan -binding protein [Nitrococcus sp.]